MTQITTVPFHVHIYKCSYIKKKLENININEKSDVASDKTPDSAEWRPVSKITAVALCPVSDLKSVQLQNDILWNVLCSSEQTHLQERTWIALHKFWGRMSGKIKFHFNELFVSQDEIRSNLFWSLEHVKNCLYQLRCTLRPTKFCLFKMERIIPLQANIPTIHDIFVISLSLWSCFIYWELCFINFLYMR